jgi:acyl-CoA synthetase (AMP-forming)/AMP-acid ligase II
LQGARPVEIVAALPKSGTGKILRRRLREAQRAPGRCRQLESLPEGARVKSKITP